MEYVVLGLGSNKSYKGDSCIELLQKACTMLAEVLTNICITSVYKTGAMYVVDQDDFYNMAVGGFFEGTPTQLLNKIHIIEGNLGRNRALEFRNGPRSMDIDIEIFGNRKIKDNNLVIPHERLFERSFVLTPLLEIFDSNADVNFNESKEIYLPEINADKTFCKSFCQLRLEELNDQKIVLCVTKDDFEADLEKKFGKVFSRGV